MQKPLLAALIGSTLLAGCYSLPTPTAITMEQIRSYDGYGSYPRNYEQLIKRHLRQTLVDPNSLMLDGISRPLKFVRFERRSLPVKTHTPIRTISGYVVCARFNAKNRYGGYTGWQEQPYLIRDGKVYDNVFGTECVSREEPVVSVEAGSYIKVFENGKEIRVNP
ncbi:hypothetical protein [Eikenella glucosivorans]|nr:hypothetical protein [Eikenella glucosivorans]